ncbi:[Fe-S]-binding protein, partial [Candidatus Poribacteria bacterium]|nr:[Fe-S]-binding protein [Candidatus Poribacteria bacterium]
MLTTVEKLLFSIAVLVSLYFAYVTFRRMVKIILRGEGQLDFDHLPRRLLTGLVALVSQNRMIRQRPVIFLFHAFIAWGFIFYLLVNMMDILEGYIPGFRFLRQSTLGSIYRLLADVLSIAVLVGMTFFLIRRFVAKTPVLAYHDNIKLHPKALSGISRDSLIVGVFILAHVGFRFLSASFLVAMEGGDAWQPFANQVAKLWSGLPESAITIGWRMS